MGQYDGWKCTHSASIIASTATTATIRVTCYWTNTNWNYDLNYVSGWVYCGNNSYLVKDNSWLTATTSNTSYSLGYYDFVVNKTTSAQNISCYARIKCGSSYSPGDRSSTATSVTVPAKTSYTITYNANGGSGVPAKQTKWHGTALTLSSTKPSRTGYTFSKWNTKSDGTGTSYNSGASYTGNASLTLYAIWTANKYTITYNANGGSGAPAAQTKTHGTNLTLSSTKPTRTNYNFLGWSTSANGGVNYEAGDTFTTNANTTLYAVWSLAYTKPRITNFKAQRCDSAGTASETGTYVKVTFNWATDKTVSAIKTEHKLQTASSYTATAVTASGTSGSVSKVIGGGAISTESSYHVRAYVTDSGGTTYSTVVSVGTVAFPIDIRKGGKGVAIGKVAETDNLFDVKFPVKVRSYINAEGSVVSKGHNLLGGPGGIYQTFTVGGDADVYYPVRFTLNSSYGGRSGFPYAKFTLSRAYAWTAPDTWANATHRGGLTFSWYWTGDSVWGGNDHSLKVIRFSETYSTMVSGIQASTAGIIVWLRGGGAKYQLDNEFGLSVTITVHESAYTDSRPTTFSPMSYNASQVLTQIKKQMLVPLTKELYNNESGTAGTVTLNETAANFAYIEIYYQDNHNTEGGYIKIYKPNSKTVDLSIVEASTATSTYIRRTEYTISGTTITPNLTTTGYAFLENNGVWPSDGSNYNYLKIVRVVGTY